MSAIEHLLPWDQQPQEAVGIDWGNPLARGLLLAVAGNGAAGGRQYATPFGIGVRGATAPAPAVRHGVANSTILAVHALPLPDGGNFWSSDDFYADTSAVWPADLGLFMRSPTRYGRIVVGARNTSGMVVDTGFDIDAYPGDLPLGGRFVAAATIGSDLLVRGFGDGGYAGSSTKLQGHSYNPPAVGAAAPRVSVPAGATSDTVTAQLLVLRWGRVLSDDEIAQISANPWQLFEPRRIPVPVSAGGGGSWSVSLTETASASDSLGAATTALVSLIESASAADIIGAATIAAVALTEAASASDTQTASYSVTGSGSVTESASASDTLDAATTMLRALTETASADDQLAAATTMLRAISESASAVDTPAASYSGAGTATIEELTSATDALTAAATLLVTILEAGSATDALAAATTMVRAITEQATAADEVAASQPIIASVSITELATAIDVLIGELTGGAWVAGDGLMSKPRIGMARNGDLYSLVLDDDGIPVACKRMGTSRLLKLRALPGGNQAQVMVETGVVLVVL